MNKLIFNNNGTLIANAKYDCVSIVDARDPSSLETYINIPKAHKGLIRTLCFTPDNNYLISGGEDNLIKIWDLKTQGRLQVGLKGHTDSINAVLANDNYIVSASSDNTVKIWNIKTRKLLTTFEDHTNEVCSLAINNNYLVSGGLDKTIRVRSLNEEYLSFTLYGHTSGINNLIIKGKYLASSSWDNTLKLWNLSTGALVNTHCSNNYTISTILFHPDKNKVFLTYKGTYSIFEWNPFSNEIETRFKGHQTTITSMIINRTYSEKGNQLLSVSTDKDVKVWSI